MKGNVSWSVGWSDLKYLNNYWMDNYTIKLASGNHRPQRKNATDVGN